MASSALSVRRLLSPRSLFSFPKHPFHLCRSSLCTKSDSEASEVPKPDTVDTLQRPLSFERPLENNLDQGVYKAILVGLVGQVPVQKHLKSGRTVTLFSVGTGGIRNNRRPLDNEEPREYAERCSVQWHRVSIYPERLGSLAMNHVKPGPSLPSSATCAIIIVPNSPSLSISPSCHLFLRQRAFVSLLSSTPPAIVLFVEYKLMPEHCLPATYDDPIDAVRWVRDQVATDPWMALVDFSHFLDRHRQVFFDGDCKFGVEGGYSLSYRKKITGKVSFTSLKELKGVKVLFVWLNIDQVSTGNGELAFYVGLLSASFPLSNFADSPQCGCGSILFVEGNLETKIFTDPVTGLVRRVREVAVRRDG
ncbi:hypothetical protein ACLOJK_032408 [Asimina triloba]